MDILVVVRLSALLITRLFLLGDLTLEDNALRTDQQLLVVHTFIGIRNFIRFMGLVLE
jgi:hypothetical protein